MLKRKNIMRFRIDKGLTRPQLAKMLDVTTQWVGQIENCKFDGGRKFWLKFKERFNLTDEEITHLKKMEE